MSVEVTDCGRGMDEPTLARIFQPFFTTKPGGMGLGLSISQTIVAAHGGTLSARSTPGIGTTFRMELPSRPPDVVRHEPGVAVPAIASGSVSVIDDEPSMRRALLRQLQSAGYEVRTFASAQSYLEHPPPTGVACIVSDVRMPGLSGLDLQASLAQAKRELPIVFVSGHGDIHTTVQAMKAGAVSFLPKPFTKGELLAAVADAMVKSRAIENAREENAELRSRYKSLTAREREVFALVVEGLLNKIIADRLGAAETTIKIHRGRVMDKMGAASLPDLVRMAERLKLALTRVEPPVKCSRPALGYRAPSRDHAALEELVDDRCRHLVQELRPQLWVLPEEFYRAPLHVGRRRGLVGGELLASRRLILLYHLLGDHIEHRIPVPLRGYGDGPTQQYEHQRITKVTTLHGISSRNRKTTARGRVFLDPIAWSARWAMNQ